MSVLKSILSNSPRLSASTRRPEDVKMLRLALYIQNEDGVEITFGTESYLFSVFFLVNSFVCRMPSSRFAVVDLNVPIYIR